MVIKSKTLGGLTFEIGAVREANSKSIIPEEGVKGFYVKPSKHVDGRPSDITNYLLSSENSHGKVEWIRNNVRDSAKAASTTNLNLFSTTEVDGYTLQEGDRVLIKSQTDKTENGIYTFESGTLVRSSDAQEGTSANDILIPVLDGATYVLTLWNCIDDESLFGEETNWATVSGGGGGTPGLPLGSLQYNDGGLFKGSAGVAATETSLDLSLNTNLNLGSGSSLVSTSNGDLDVEATNLINTYTDSFIIKNDLGTERISIDTNDINFESVNNSIKITNNLTIKNNVDDDALTVDNDKHVEMLANLESTSTTTGSLRVTGGVGVTGNIHLGGDITADEINANSYNSLSDIRFKDNIRKIRNPLYLVDNISGYTYTLKNDPKKRQWGVIAQELEQNELKELVTEDSEGVKRVSYNGLIPILLESIKYLQSEVEDLKRIIRHSSSELLN